LHPRARINSSLRANFVKLLASHLPSKRVSKRLTRLIFAKRIVELLGTGFRSRIRTSREPHGVSKKEHLRSVFVFAE